MPTTICGNRWGQVRNAPKAIRCTVGASEQAGPHSDAALVERRLWLPTLRNGFRDTCQACVCIALSLANGRGVPTAAVGTSDNLPSAAFCQTSEDSAAGPSPHATRAEAAKARHHKSAGAPQCNTMRLVRVGVGFADEEHLRRPVHGVLVDRTTRSGTWESTAPLPGRNPDNASSDRRPNNASSRQGARRHGEGMSECAGTLLQALAVSSLGVYLGESP